MNTVSMAYRFAVIDQYGRMWAKTLTSIKAARLVRELRESKGLICHIAELSH